MRHTAPSFAGSPSITPERVATACGHAVDEIRAATDPARAVEAALNALHDGLDGALVAAFVVEHARLWNVGGRGYAIIPDGLPLDRGVIGRAARLASTQFVADVEADPDYVEVAQGIRSELALSLVTPAGVVGVIDIASASPLPHGSERHTADLAAVLAPAVEALQSTRTINLSSLARLFVYVSSLREPQEIADVTVRSVARVLPLETSQLMLASESGELVELAGWRAPGGGPEPLPPAAFAALRDRVDASALVEVIDASTLRLPELFGTHVRSIVLIPLRVNGEEIGLLVGSSRFAKELDRHHSETAALLAAHSAASLDAALALGREQRNAHTDELTGLLNRRGFEVRLERELERAQAERRPLSLIVLDCDDFKEVNDRAGHEFGDALLRELGRVLRSAVAEPGCPARFGGDEFVVMLPEADSSGAERVVLGLRERLAAGLDEAGFPLHVSAGVSTYPYDGEGASQLLRAADQALYTAKARGKDRAVVFRDLLGSGAGAQAGSPEETGSRRGSAHPDSSKLEDAMRAAITLGREQTVESVLDRLGKSLTFVIGATGVQISRVQGDRLVDITQHVLRDVDLGDDSAYLIDEFPLTKDVLESGVSRAISFLDEDLDRAEAFVLRELKMNCCLLLPLRVAGRSWGLVELYDRRLRRFTDEDRAVADFLIAQATRRLESLGAAAAGRPRPPLFRLPLFRLPR